MMHWVCTMYSMGDKSGRGLVYKRSAGWDVAMNVICRQTASYFWPNWASSVQHYIDKPPQEQI